MAEKTLGSGKPQDSSLPTNGGEYSPLHHTIALTDSGRVFHDAVIRINQLVAEGKDLYPGRFSDYVGEEDTSITTVPRQPNEPYVGKLLSPEAIAIEILSVEYTGLAKVAHHLTMPASSEADAGEQFAMREKLIEIVGGYGHSSDVVEGIARFAGMLGVGSFVRELVQKGIEPTPTRQRDIYLFGDVEYGKDEYLIFKQSLAEDKMILGHKTVSAILDMDYFADYLRPDEIEQYRKWEMMERSSDIKRGVLLASQLYLEALDLATQERMRLIQPPQV